MSSLASASAMRRYALRERLRGLRLLPGLAVAALPCLIALMAALFAQGGDNPFALYGEYILPISVYFVIPFVAMFSVLPLIGDLYDNSTIGYLYTRPAPRWASLLGIYQGTVIAMLPALLCSAWVPGIILFMSDTSAEFGPWISRMVGLSAVLLIGGAAYGAVCLFFGVWSKRAIIWALFALIGWGIIFGALPGTMRTTSPHRYLISLARSWCNVDNTWNGMFIPDTAPPNDLTAILVLLIGTLVFLALAARAANRREVL